MDANKLSLGFDTSCYTTSAAAVNERGEVLASARMLLPVQSGQRGLRQSEAVFAHVRQMPLVVDQLMSALSEPYQIVSVCASKTPRDEANSYMPVFAVGYGHASALARILKVPLYTTSHQRGHITAGLLGGTALETPFVALHLSGGTTELLECGSEALRLIGGSLDLHAGQLVDRVGVKLGLSFPAGPALEKLALTCCEQAGGELPVSLEQNDLYCHLSGAETRALQLLEAYKPERIAMEVFDLLARTVSRMLIAARDSTGAKQALVVGGVASSALLRKLVIRRLEKARSPLETHFGMPEYSTDNAAGVAAIGMRAYLQEHNNTNGGKTNGGTIAGW